MQFPEAAGGADLALHPAIHWPRSEGLSLCIGLSAQANEPPRCGGIACFARGGLFPL
jgi:hypothetical protein